MTARCDDFVGWALAHRNESEFLYPCQVAKTGGKVFDSLNDASRIIKTRRPAGLVLFNLRSVCQTPARSDRPA